jgi:predicted esterase
MRSFIKIITAVATVSIAVAVCTYNAGEAESGGDKIICFTNCAGVNGMTEIEAALAVPAHRLYWAIVDDELTQVKVLPEKNPDGLPVYDIRSGPCVATINAAGYITAMRAVEGLATGFSTYAPENGKIRLGVKGTEYSYRDDIQVYKCCQYYQFEEFKIDITDIVFDFNDEYSLILDESGIIVTMYINVGIGEDPENLYQTIQKFDSARGPVDGATGLSTEYVYFKPEKGEHPNASQKYPLVVWLHGEGRGRSTWSSLFYYNDIARFATDAFQAEFQAGGAYIMCPRANEEFGMTWNKEQTGAVFGAVDDFIARNPNIDTDRIYIGGYSMGGGMTWLMLKQRPDFFAAAFPHCAYAPYMPEVNELFAYAAMPLWVFHGYFDPVESVQSDLKIKPLLQAYAIKMGTDTRFTIYNRLLMPDGKTETPDEHYCWIPALNNLRYNDGSMYADMYGNPVKSTLISWLNEQTKSLNAARSLETIFSDVNKGDWFYNYVMELTLKGIVGGKSGGLFEPNSNLTYGEALKLVMLASGGEVQAPTGEHWASGYMDTALEEGLLDKKVDLNKEIIRLDVADLAANALGLETTMRTSPFKDTSYSAILALYEVGIVEGNPDGKFKPYAKITRAEISAMIYRINEYVQNGGSIAAETAPKAHDALSVSGS